MAEPEVVVVVEPPLPEVRIEVSEVGLVGPRGPKGNTGDQGIQGIQGLKGDKGDQGDIGPQGIQGVKGDQGDIGPQGIQGLKGDKGDKGDQGDIGPQGIQGVKGDQGDIGPQGIQGIQGLKGDTGDQGIQGVKGDKGDKGDPGDQVPANQSTLTSIGIPNTPQVRTITLGGNATVLNPPSGMSATSSIVVTLVLKQPATGGPYTVTFPTVEWVNDAIAPAMPTPANAELIVSFLWTGVAWRGLVVGVFFP